MTSESDKDFVKQEWNISVCVTESIGQNKQANKQRPIQTRSEGKSSKKRQEYSSTCTMDHLRC